MMETAVGQRAEVWMDEHNLMFAPFLNKTGILDENMVTLDGVDYYIFSFDAATELHGLRLESVRITVTDDSRNLRTGMIYFIFVIVPSTWLTAMGYAGSNLDNGVAACMRLAK